MKKFDILNNFIEIDEETTREYYKISSEWGCECLHCRNFLALARERKLPQDKASEVFSWGEMRCTHEIYPYGAPDFPKPHFDLEFWLTLPMILEE